MLNVRVPADILVTLIRIYKTKGLDNLDPEARKHYTAIHQLEFAATSKLRSSRQCKPE